MNVGKVNVDSTYKNFSANENNSATTISFSADEDKLEINRPHKKKRSLSAKKWGVGIASFVVSGAGQWINGDVSKGFAFFGANIGLGSLALLLANKAKGLSTAVLIAGAGINIFGIVDAVKNVKPDQE